jgi:hypothetical protein
MSATRRRFLVSAATVVGGTLIFSLHGCSGGGSGDHAQLRLDVSALLPEEAGKLGKAWLASADPEGGADGAATALFDALQEAGAELSDVAGLADAVREQASADYRAERTAEVKGWHLSLTELRLCALAS